MGDGKVNARKLVIKEGMTPQDVKNNPKATPQQKAFACVFDSDGVEGYSAREAEVFNSTTITCKGEKGITLWTQYQDGTKKGTSVSGDVTSFKYSPQGDVKPIIRTVKKAVKGVDQTKSLATQIVQEFEQTGKGELKVETYENGNIKSKKYKDEGYFGKEASISYYEDGKTESSKVKVWDGYNWIVTEDKNYYPNGNLKSSKTKEPKYFGKENSKTYYEDGKPESSKVKVWNSSDWIVTEDKSYYPNGKLKSSKTKEPKYFGKETYQTYHENGNPKSKVVKEWDREARFEKNYKGEYEYIADWVETTHIEYDENGNVIDKAKVTK